jgi:hypothetical protein
LAFGVFAVGLWWFVLRTKATSLQSPEDFDAIVREGQPVVAEFFSNA